MIIGVIIIIILILLFLIIYGLQSHVSIHRHLLIIKNRPTLNDCQNTNKIIWSYWHDTNYPLPVKIAIHTWIKHNPKYLICMLSKSTIHHYLDLETLPKTFNKLSIQKQTDVIRLALLEKYGGFWLDSTLYLNQSLDIEWNTKVDVGGYCADFYTTNKNKPVFESWFIYAPKNSKLITAWKEEFFKGVDLNHQDYIDELEKTVDLQKIDLKVYLMIHCSFLKVIQDKKYKWKMLPAGQNNGPFSYLVKHDWNVPKSVFYLLTSKDHPPPVLKLRYPERFITNWLIYYMQDHCLLHQLIYN